MNTQQRIVEAMNAYEIEQAHLAFYLGIPEKIRKEIIASLVDDVDERRERLENNALGNHSWRSL